MSKHTPSPWLYRGKSDSVHMPCDTHPYGDQIFRFVEDAAPSDEDLALILAAPELLEACQAFSRLYGRLWDVTEPSSAGFLSPESVKEYDAIHQLMTVAIQKATA